MKTELTLWAGVTVHFIAFGVLYAIVGDDPAGASLLLLAAGLGGVVALWTWNWRRHHRASRPEDRPDADSADEAVVLGVTLGSWMLIAGLAIVVSQVALLVRDADR